MNFDKITQLTFVCCFNSRFNTQRFLLCKNWKRFAIYTTDELQHYIYRNKDWNRCNCNRRASLRRKCCQSLFGLLSAQIRQAAWIRLWQILTVFACAASTKSMFQIVAIPKQNLRYTSVWPLCCTKSLNWSSCLVPLVGNCLAICRGNKFDKAFGANPCAIL